MTTKVRITLEQEHMPVIVEVLRSDGSISYFAELSGLGYSVCEYVHSGQTLRVRELTTAEMHAKGVGRAP